MEIYVIQSVQLSRILLSNTRAPAMSGGAEISSSTMSCVCPPDCCSPEVEKKEENYVWLLIKVLIHDLFILLIFSHHLLLIIILCIYFLHTTIFLASFVTFDLQVLYSQWMVMGFLALPIIARQPKKLKDFSICN